MFRSLDKPAVTRCPWGLRRLWLCWQGTWCLALGCRLYTAQDWNRSCFNASYFVFKLLKELCKTVSRGVNCKTIASRVVVNSIGVSVPSKVITWKKRWDFAIGYWNLREFSCFFSISKLIYSRFSYINRGSESRTQLSQKTLQRIVVNCGPIDKEKFLK